jgi:hypothetical protein
MKRCFIHKRESPRVEKRNRKTACYNMLQLAYEAFINGCHDRKPSLQLDYIASAIDIGISYRSTDNLYRWFAVECTYFGASFSVETCIIKF